MHAGEQLSRSPLLQWAGTPETTRLLLAGDPPGQEISLHGFTRAFAVLTKHLAIHRQGGKVRQALQTGELGSHQLEHTHLLKNTNGA